jgi:hypothetical protein
MPDLEAVGGNAVTEEVKVNAEEPITADPTDGDEVDPQAQPKEGEEEHKKKLGGWQRKQLKAEAERDYWRDVALEKLAAKPKEEVKPAPDEVEPDPEKFESTLEYLKAVRAYDRLQIKKEIAAEQTAKEQERTQKTEQQKQAEAWEQKKVAAREKYTDFDEALEADVPVTKAISTALLRSDMGADLAYYLGTHTEEAQKIAKMDDLEAAMALGRIEAQLAKPEQAKEEEPKPEIKAPPKPITPIKKSAPVTTVDLNDPKVAYKDWVKAREQALHKAK